jgi:hypothetical protein
LPAGVRQRACSAAGATLLRAGVSPQLLGASCDRGRSLIREAGLHASTDADDLCEGDDRSMSAARSCEPVGAAPASTYAAALCAYAAPKLDAWSLRCWLIHRLMRDEGLDHASAELIVDQLLVRARCASASVPRLGTARGGRPSVQRLRTRLHRIHTHRYPRRGQVDAAHAGSSVSSPSASA